MITEATYTKAEPIARNVAARYYPDHEDCFEYITTADEFLKLTADALPRTIKATCRYLAFTWNRSEKRHIDRVNFHLESAEMQDHAQNPENAVIDREAEQSIKALFARVNLSELEERILTPRMDGSITVEEIAYIEGLTITQAYGASQRARRKLLPQLKRLGEEKGYNVNTHAPHLRRHNLGENRQLPDRYRPRIDKKINFIQKEMEKANA